MIISLLFRCRGWSGDRRRGERGNFVIGRTALCQGRWRGDDRGRGVAYPLAEFLFRRGKRHAQWRVQIPTEKEPSCALPTAGRWIRKEQTHQGKTKTAEGNSSLSPNSRMITLRWPTIGLLRAQSLLSFRILKASWCKSEYVTDLIPSLWTDPCTGHMPTIIFIVHNKWHY